MLKELRFWDGTLQFFYAFHKGPVAFKYCALVGNDYDGIVNAINHVQWKDWKDSLLTYSSTLLFNAIDIYYEVLVAMNSYSTSDWT